MVKNLPAMQKTQVRSLGQEDPLEMGMATHSSILAWRIPGTGEPGGLPSMGSHRVGHVELGDDGDRRRVGVSSGTALAWCWGTFLASGAPGRD